MTERAESEIRRTIEAVWRIEAPRIIASLTRLVRDVGLAEELAQDAFVVALEKWPEAGVPDNPGAWLTATAKHRALDRLRHAKLAERKHEEIGLELLDRFVSCHPVLSREARVALTLRLLGGLTTPEIARAFLVPEATVAQRIVRAKRTLADAKVPFEVPRGTDRAARLSSVLEVIYLVFNEGYAATAGEDWLRPALCDEALRLGRVLAGLAPEEPEVHGLVALMEIQASRAKARVGPDGEPILLLDQDRARWDQLLVHRGLAALARAERLATNGEAGPYQLQAAIAACHARAGRAEETDWPRIVGIYDELARGAPSPVVDLNRAVAVSMASGPEAALELVDRLGGERALEGYHLLPAVRADLLRRLGRNDEARVELERAAALTRNEREKALLLARAAALAEPAVAQAEGA